MTIALLPIYYDMIYVDTKTGRLSNEAQLFQDQTFQTLDSVVDQFINGLVMPTFTTTEIAAMAASATIGTMYFDTTKNKMVFIDNTNSVQTITST